MEGRKRQENFSRYGEEALYVVAFAIMSKSSGTLPIVVFDSLLLSALLGS